MSSYSLEDQLFSLMHHFETDHEKQKFIISLIKETGHLAIFAYGSLMWNPISHTSEIIENCSLIGYKKEFTCQDIFYRGTRAHPGLTLGLFPESGQTVRGLLLMARGNEIIPFIEEFVKRETPSTKCGVQMRIYTYRFLKVLLPDGINSYYALTCVADQTSPFNVRQMLSLEQQAETIARAYGHNGTNLHYVEKFINICRELNIYDSSTNEIENLFDKALQYRQCLPRTDQSWLMIYDQVSTAEKREQMMRKREITIRNENVGRHS